MNINLEQVNVGQDNSLEIDIQKFRDRLVSERALNEQNRTRAVKAKETISKIFSSISEDSISKLESRGIFVRKIMSFDLDRVLTDKAYNQEFLEEFKKVMSQIKDLLESESRE